MRTYKVPFTALSVTNDADQDVIELVNGAGVLARLIEIRLESELLTDERVRMRLVRRTSTGSGGVACTEVPLDAGDAAAIVAVNQLVTTPGTAGPVLDAFAWSQLAPFIYLPVPEGRPLISPSGRLALNLQTAVGATRAWSGFVTWGEEG